MSNEVTPEAKRIWNNLAKATADAIECRETPDILVNALAENMNDIVDLLKPTDARQALAAHLRGLTNEFMRLHQDAGNAAPGHTVTRADAESRAETNSGANLTP